MISASGRSLYFHTSTSLSLSVDTLPYHSITPSFPHLHLVFLCNQTLDQSSHGNKSVSSARLPDALALCLKATRMETKEFEFRPAKETSRSKSPGGIVGRLSNFARNKTRHSLSEKGSNSVGGSGGSGFERPRKVRKWAFGNYWELEIWTQWQFVTKWNPTQKCFMPFLKMMIILMKTWLAKGRKLVSE